jgi:hypothetical protein
MFMGINVFRYRKVIEDVGWVLAVVVSPSSAGAAFTLHTGDRQWYGDRDTADFAD